MDMRTLIITLWTLSLFLSTSARAQDLTVMVKMRDGVKLATDVYLPKNKKGPWPVLLIRTPYDKKNQKAAAKLWTLVGVLVVAQDMRGRYASQGTDMVFTTDGDGKLKDGADTMAWIVAQKAYCNGLIATLGGSALGIVQYMQATAKPKGLKLLHAVVATPNLYQDGMFYGGVFRNSMVTGWLQGQKSTHFLKHIALHPYEDAFWASVQTRDQYKSVTTAGLHTGGWHDIFLQGNIDAYRGYQHQGGPGAKGKQKLVIGPWTHGGMAKVKQGELTFPKNSTGNKSPFPNPFNTMANHYLKLKLPAIKKTPADIPNVQYYVMGDVTQASAPGNVWRSAKDWPPPAAPVRLHLQPGGGLAESCPAAAGGSTSYTFDPAKPSPTVCGRNLKLPAGSCDQAKKVESRGDVVLFSTPKLQKPMEITGRVRVHLFTKIDQKDADLMVRLTDVYPDGRSMLIADGAARLAARGSTKGIKPLTPGELVHAVVDLWSTSIIINKGHKLRISITSSNYPRFAVNRNTGLPYPLSVTGPGKKVKVTLHHSTTRASYVVLPDPGRKPVAYTKCGVVKPDAGVDGPKPPKDKGPGKDTPLGKDKGPLKDAPSAKDSGPGKETSPAADGPVGDGGADAADDAGCSCVVGQSGSMGGYLWLVALALVWRRSRRQACARRSS